MDNLTLSVMEGKIVSSSVYSPLNPPPPPPPPPRLVHLHSLLPLHSSLSLVCSPPLFFQALGEGPTEQLLQQIQAPQYAYAPSMSQPWVLPPSPPSSLLPPLRICHVALYSHMALCYLVWLILHSSLQVEEQFPRTTLLLPKI